MQDPKHSKSIKCSIASAGVLLVASISPSLAQQGAPPFPIGGAPGAAGGQPGGASQPVEINPNASRFIGPEKLAEFLQESHSGLDILKRKADPFGQVQDPTQPPPKTAATSRPTRTFRKTAFSDIIERIKINTVMPSENRFMTRNRSFKLGDQFPLRYKGGKEFMVEVVAVNAKQVDFKKVDTGEIASVKLGVKPPGMSSGIKGISTPGMQSNNPNATLQVDPLTEF